MPDWGRRDVGVSRVAPVPSAVHTDPCADCPSRNAIGGDGRQGEQSVRATGDSAQSSHWVKGQTLCSTDTLCRTAPTLSAAEGFGRLDRGSVDLSDQAIRQGTD